MTDKLSKKTLIKCWNANAVASYADSILLLTYLLTYILAYFCKNHSLDSAVASTKANNQNIISSKITFQLLANNTK